MNKIHFINRIDYTNAGDRACCPLNYFYDYFSKFPIFRHDIDYIRWDIIDYDDIVILGASGMLYCTESFNENINKLLQRCKTVIGWSIGFNTHSVKEWLNGDSSKKINFEKFKLISIRDYNHESKIEYIPDPSVLALKNRIEHPLNIKRNIGFIEHKDLELKINKTNITIRPQDWIKHNESINNIINFILGSSKIVTNSYHCAYWSILLNKKTIVVDSWSSKFNYFKFEPLFVDSKSINSIDALESIFDRARSYPDAFEDSLRLTNNFFEKVKQIVESSLIADSDEKNFQYIDEISYSHSWNIQDKFRVLANASEGVRSNEKVIRLLNEELCRVGRDMASMNDAVDKFCNTVNNMENTIKSLIETQQGIKKVIKEQKSIIKLMEFKVKLYEFLFCITRNSKYKNKIDKYVSNINFIKE